MTVYFEYQRPTTHTPHTSHTSTTLLRYVCSWPFCPIYPCFSVIFYTVHTHANQRHFRRKIPMFMKQQYYPLYTSSYQRDLVHTLHTDGQRRLPRVPTIPVLLYYVMFVPGSRSPCVRLGGGWGRIPHTLHTTAN